MYFLVLIIYLVIAVPELYLLHKKKQTKETWIYAVTISFSFVVTVLIMSGVDLPNPINAIEKVFGGFAKK